MHSLFLAIDQSSSVLRASGLALAALLLIHTPVGAEDSRYPGKWEWSALEMNEIKNLVGAAKKDFDGFWELNRKGVRTRTDVSDRLGIEASMHLAQAIRALPQTIKLPASPSRVKNVRFMLTIHRTEESFGTAAPDGDPDEGFAKVSPQDDGGSLAEVHMLSKWDRHPGFDNNLVECIDVGRLQGHLARLFLHLWRPDQALPPFLAKGYESYFETHDVYKQRPRTQGIHRSDFKAALHQTIQHGKALRPGLSEMLHLSQDEFDEDPELNSALSSRFVHYLMTRAEYQKTVHQLIAPTTGMQSTQIDFKAAAALEKGWHRHLYHILALSRPVLQTDLTTEGRVPGAASVGKLSAYGNKPLLSLMPVAGGAYDLAWHNGSQRSINIMQCDAAGKKLSEFSPGFIKNAGALLGATRLLGDKGYVVGYCTNNAHGNKNTEFHVAGFSPDGSESFNTLIFGDRNQKEKNSKGGPGGAGSARIAYNEKGRTIAFYLSHNMLCGDGVRHQGGFVGFLDENGKRKSGGSGWFYSHNFDQRLIAANGEFAALAHGDAYPRALGFSRWPGSGGKAIANKTYHNIPGETGANTTNCQTGGLVALPNRRYAVVFASSNEREAHDVCVKVLDESGKTTREQWLTEGESGSASAYPRIARDGDHIFVAWHQGGELQQIILDSSLETVVPRSTNTGVKLSPYDDLHNLDNGAIVWAVPDGGNKIRVHRIDQPAVLEQSLIARSAKSKRTPKPDAVAQVDREMTIKLVELSAEKKLPEVPLSIRSAKTPVRLIEVDKDGMLHFLGDGETKLPPASFGKLPLPDRAIVTLALSENEPENLFLYGIAAFYLECSGALEAAEFYYGKAGRTAGGQFTRFFE